MSCEDELPFNPVGLTYYTAWNPHPAVRLDNIHLQNAYATEDRLYVIGANHFLTFDENHELLDDYLISREAISISVENVPTITDNVFGYLDYQNEDRRTKLKLHLNKNPDVSMTIDLEDFNPDWLMYSRHSQQFVITPDNELIFPVSCPVTFTPNGYRDTSALKMVSFDLNITNNSLEATLKDSITIMREKITFINSGLFFQDEQLYFSMQYVGTYQMDWSTKDFRRITDAGYAYYLPASDTTFIVMQDRSNGVLEFNYSTDTHNTQWNINQFYFDPFMRFVLIEDEIIGYRTNQIVHIKTGFPNSMYLSLIQNDEIDTYIDRIIEFKDRVYLVTPTGLFHKTKENFFQYSTN